MDYKMIHYTVERSIATITLDYAPCLLYTSDAADE